MQSSQKYHVFLRPFPVNSPDLREDLESSAPYCRRERMHLKNTPGALAKSRLQQVQAVFALG